MARPSVTLKFATSMDSKIALSSGLSQWITNEKSRKAGHRLRASHDAIAIGAVTALLDDPRLTTRIEGQADPVRIVYDSRLRLPPGSNLARTAAEVPVWLFSKNAKGRKAAQLSQLGVKIFPVKYHASGPDKGLDIQESLSIMADNGISSLLVEGGGHLAASFLKAGVVDRIEWFRASVIIGADGRDAIADLGVKELFQMYRFELKSAERLGSDSYERYQRADA